MGQSINHSEFSSDSGTAGGIGSQGHYSEPDLFRGLYEGIVHPQSPFYHPEFDTRIDFSSAVSAVVDFFKHLPALELDGFGADDSTKEIK